MGIHDFTTAVPVIATADVTGTIAYFEKILGFRQQWTWGEPPVYAGVKAGGAMLYISHDPELAAAIRERRLAPDVFLWVRDIDSAYDRHRASGAEIVEELSTRPWGLRQYAMKDLNGYNLKITELTEPEETR